MPPDFRTVTAKRNGGANMGTTTSAYATCAGFEIHYLTWGDPPSPVLCMAWPTGHDFAPLAAAWPNITG